MTNTYTTKLDMQTGTINICGGDTRFPILIDEWPALMESGKAEYERAKAIMGNPLLDTRTIDEAMQQYHAINNVTHSHVAPEFKALIKFYQNTLLMLREFKASISAVCHEMEKFDNGSFADEYLELTRWNDKLATILEAHKQHMPAIVEGE